MTENSINPITSDLREKAEEFRAASRAHGHTAKPIDRAQLSEVILGAVSKPLRETLAQKP